MSKPANTYTIGNIAGGHERSFRLGANGQISDASIRHARNIGFGGPVFGGPAGDEARRQFELIIDPEVAE